MKNTYQLKLKYPASLSVHNITSLVESVNGVKIQRLNIISRGWDFVGVVVVEASGLLRLADQAHSFAGLLHYDSLIRLIRSRKEVCLEESEFVHIQSI
jgi:hypothetical protein